MNLFGMELHAPRDHRLINTIAHVVPVLKPTCSGSGYQDNVFDFKVQNDFPANVCNATGACVLQVYAHSVESRMYSSGTPVIVTGGTGIWDEKAAKEAEKDLAFGLDKLRPLCLSRADPTSHHTNAVLYKARGLFAGHSACPFAGPSWCL